MRRLPAAAAAQRLTRGVEAVLEQPTEQRARGSGGRRWPRRGGGPGAQLLAHGGSLSPLSPGSAPAGRGGASTHTGARARSSVRWGCGARAPPAGGGARRRRPACSALQRGGHRPPPGTRRPPRPSSRANVRVPGRRVRHLRDSASSPGSALGRGRSGRVPARARRGCSGTVTLGAGTRCNSSVT